MELDDLKHAWQALDSQLQRQNALSLQALRDRRIDAARRGLRPLFQGQVLQIGFGALMALLGATGWSGHADVPHLFAAGLVVHVYGVLAIIAAGVLLGRLRRIDYAAPVVVIQKQLANARRAHVIGGMVAGLPWWLLWLPVTLLLAGLAGIDLHARAPSFVWISLAVGIAGLLGTGWLLRWSRHPSRPALAARVEDSMTGHSLRKARAMLDEVARFEAE